MRGRRECAGGGSAVAGGAELQECVCCMLMCICVCDKAEVMVVVVVEVLGVMHSWVSPQEYAAPTLAQTGVITTSSPCSHTIIQPAQVCRCSVPFPGTSRKRLSINPVRKRLVNHIMPLRPFLDCTCEVRNTGTSGGSLHSALQPVIKGLFQSAQVCLLLPAWRRSCCKNNLW